jgi:hypothetical protein
MHRLSCTCPLGAKPGRADKRPDDPKQDADAACAGNRLRGRRLRVSRGSPRRRHAGEAGPAGAGDGRQRRTRRVADRARSGRASRSVRERHPDVENRWPGGQRTLPRRAAGQAGGIADPPRRRRFRSPGAAGAGQSGEERGAAGQGPDRRRALRRPAGSRFRLRGKGQRATHHGSGSGSKRQG